MQRKTLDARYAQRCLGGRPMDEATRLRLQAERARYYARYATMEDDRFAWIAIAERWERLADDTEKKEGGEKAGK